MILKILKTAVINIEMIASTANLAPSEMNEIAMSLYHLNNGIDLLEKSQNEIKTVNEMLAELSKQNIHLMNEIRIRDNGRQSNVLEPLYEDFDKG